MEEWRDIPGYEGLYQVSNYGRVKSLSNGIGRKEKILKQNKSSRYFKVGLSMNSKQKHYYIHRLVAEVFVPNPNRYTAIHHINHNRTDNRAENLEWIDKETHMELHNIEKKQVYQYTIRKELVKVWDSTLEASKVLGVSSGNISNCCYGGYYSEKRNKWVNRNECGGYIWSYKPL